MGTHLALKAVCCSHFAPDFITHAFKGQGLRQNGEDRKSPIQRRLKRTMFIAVSCYFQGAAFKESHLACILELERCLMFLVQEITIFRG